MLRGFSPTQCLSQAINDEKINEKDCEVTNSIAQDSHLGAEVVTSYSCESLPPNVVCQALWMVNSSNALIVENYEEVFFSSSCSIPISLEFIPLPLKIRLAILRLFFRFLTTSGS